jgi:glycosyltransferase involved in cell wall biosynthesis
VTEPPVVSVVLCAWQPREDWFRDAVASVLADDAVDELIIVDDGSPEPVEPLLADAADPRLRVVRVEHGGLARARNAGIRAARGAFVRFADADDLVEPGGTRALLDLADERTVTYGATQVCDENLRPLLVKGSKLEGAIAEACLLYRFDVVHTSMLFPRQVLDKVGDFEPELRQCQDWDFVLRACETAPVRGTQATVTRYRRHVASVSANLERAMHFESIVVDRYFERHPEQRGTRLEREARAKLLLVRAATAPRVGEGRLSQARYVARAFALHPRRTVEELTSALRRRGTRSTS